MSNEAALQKQIDELKAKLAQSEKAAAAKVSLKVGQSGTVCLYHGARYPLSLYRSQWERILPFIKSGKVEEFISSNAALLATDKA